MKTAATYHRVSTTDQNPALARDELRAAAAMRGLAVALEIEETGSGARNNRPGLAKLMELTGRGVFSYILVWKLDRFGRSALDVLTNVRRLVDAGVTFVCTSQGLQVGPDSGPMGNLILTVMAAMAEFERSIIQERTRLGLADARKRGVHLGRRQLLTAHQLARASALRSAGQTWGKIAQEMGFGKRRGILSRAVGRVRT